MVSSSRLWRRQRKVCCPTQLPIIFGRLQGPSRSDIFALGSTIHEIVGGYEPFPELDSGMDGEVIQGRFVAEQYPDVRVIPGGEIIRKCWLQQYSGAHECLTDLKALEEQC